MVTSIHPVVSTGEELDERREYLRRTLDQIQSGAADIADEGTKRQLIASIEDELSQLASMWSADDDRMLDPATR